MSTTREFESEKRANGGIDPADPIAMGAARFMGDPLVQMFLAKIREVELAKSIFEDTTDKREEARRAFLVVDAITIDIKRWASGQITEGERAEIDARIALLNQQMSTTSRTS